MEANLNSSATTVQEDYAAHTPRDVVRGARILCEALLREGVDTIFGYPGGAVLPIYDELAKMRDHLRHILARHEQGAVHMAEGYAKATGKVGVVLVTSGPGATNAVTGIANAYMDSTPLVVFTGQVPRKLIGSDAFQESIPSASRCPARNTTTWRAMHATWPKSSKRPSTSPALGVRDLYSSISRRTLQMRRRRSFIPNACGCPVIARACWRTPGRCSELWRR